MRYVLQFGLTALLVVCSLQGTSAADKVFRAGAFAIDITPLELPVLVNGNMNAVSADKVNDRLHARCLVLDDGTNQAAIVIVDSCMLPRTLLEITGGLHLTRSFLATFASQVGRSPASHRPMPSESS